jgi:fumarate reductase (CoM/CoB) subunit A
LTRIEEMETLCKTCRVESPIQLMRRLDLDHMLRVSKMVCKAALYRAESRGAHYRSDFPQERNPEWQKNVLIRKADSENMTLEAVATVHQSALFADR